jgi:hypothetical protein
VAPLAETEGRELDAGEQAYAVGVICRWIERELALPRTPT